MSDPSVDILDPYTLNHLICILVASSDINILKKTIEISKIWDFENLSV